jgi:hypothetical protein
VSIKEQSTVGGLVERNLAAFDERSDRWWGRCENSGGTVDIEEALGSRPLGATCLGTLRGPLTGCYLWNALDAGVSAAALYDLYKEAVRPTYAADLETTMAKITGLPSSRID